jgi:hypothetical protein
MRNNLTPFLFFLLGIVVTVASGQAPAKERGVLSVLHVGQPVTLKASETGYEINTLQNGPEVLGHKVVEVARDFVVLEDIAGINAIHIPIYSVRSVTVTKIGGNR